MSFLVLQLEQSDSNIGPRLMPSSEKRICFVWFDSLPPINNLSVKQGRVFLGWTSTKLGLMCLAQAPQRSYAGEAQTRGLYWSRVKYSTTEPLRSLSEKGDIRFGENLDIIHQTKPIFRRE